MVIIDKILRLLKEQNLKQKELCEYLGISNNNFTEWKSGRSTSYKKYLPEIAKYLGVSVDYLVGTSAVKEVSGKELSEQALEVAELFEKLNPNNRELAFEILSAIERQQNK